MKTKVLSIVIALLLMFSLVFSASADTRAQRETEPCDHDHPTLAEAHEHLQEHKEFAPVERTFAPVKGEELRPVETPEAAEETEEPVVDPTEIPEPTEVSEEDEEPEPTPVAEQTGIPEETEEPGNSDACPHENTWDSWYWKECTYTDTGDNVTHEVTGVRVNFTYCDDCDTYIAEQEEAYSAAEEHIYENGVCLFCDHVNVCPHENTWDSWYWKDETIYTDTGDNLTHEVTGIRVNYTYCDDCNSVVAEQEEAYTEEWCHNYDENGVCTDCNHVNTCPHENTFDTWDWIDYTYTDTGSNVTHKISGIRLCYKWCEDCGAHFSEHEKEYATLETHYYVDGVCMDCGHVNSCNHEKTYFWQAETDIECTFTDTGDNMMHEMRCVHICEEICFYCGQTLSEKEETFSETRLHQYNENGVCELCDHVCSHENTAELFRWDPDTVTYPDHGSNALHGVSGVREWYSVCRDCGKSVFEREEYFTSSSLLDFSNETHTYNDDGVCEKCGHVNTCAHENTLDSWKREENEITYTDLGSEKHEVTGIRVWERYCRDCNTIIAEWEESFTKTEKHVYWGHGFCVRCGHACPHENVSDHYEWNEDATFTDTGDNLTHEANGTRTHGICCCDCKMLREWTETYSGPEAHDYNENGVCTQCGHVRNISVSITASDGGSAYGAGTYRVGETVTLIAKANRGFVFGGWTENGKIVSRCDIYAFTAESDRTLTPVFFKNVRFDPIVRPVKPIDPIPVIPPGFTR